MVASGVRAHWIAGLAIVAGSGLLAARPALAEAPKLPNWSIEKLCANDSASGQCRMFETRAWETVSGGWAFLSDSTKTECLAQVKRPADMSWRLLAECIETAVLRGLSKRAIATADTPGEPGSAPAAPTSADGVPPPAFSLPTTPPSPN